jgi:DnaK suppressor protein
MPKSKKPPVKGSDAKTVPAKPVASKAPPAPRPANPGAAPKTVVAAGKPAAKSPAVPAKAAPPKAGGKNGPVVAKNGPAKVAPAKVATVKPPKAPKVVEVPQPAEPRKWPKGGPTKAELKHYRDRLLEMRRALLSSSKELAAEALKSSGQDFSVDHMADHGSDNYEQDFSLKLLEGESEQLADIREALMKIDGKVETPFGICEACADDDQKLCETCPWIPPSRLEVLPHARLCVQTKEIEERRKQ